MDWFAEAKEKRAKDPSYGYGKIAKEYGLTYDTVRNKFRRDPEYKSEKAEIKEEIPIDQQIYDILNCNGKVLDKIYLCDKFNISPKTLSFNLDKLKSEGIVFDENSNTVSIRKIIIPKSNIYDNEWGGEKIIRFGAIADTHLGSQWEQLGFLQKLYRIFESEGIENVYHAGDLTDGFYKNRPGHIYELRNDCLGASHQAKHVINNYPDNCTTYYTLGNHDSTHVMNGGTDIADIISSKREDLKFLGYNNAVVKLTPNCKLELIHPNDGTSYAMSYQLQKYIDSLFGGEKSNLVIMGHYHKMLYMFYRNVHAFLPGCLQAQTPFQKGKKLAAHIGGFIIEIHVDSNGTITRCKNEFIPCYKPVLPNF